MAEFEPQACCTECGAHYYCAFGERTFAPNICPNCGARKTSSWPIYAMRWVSTARFLQPSTWGSGYYEVRMPDGALKPYDEVDPSREKMS